MLHPEPSKQSNRAVVHVDRKIDREHALHIAQNLPYIRVNVQVIRGDIELPLGCHEGIGSCVRPL
jgi:hypothetical protein